MHSLKTIGYYRLSAYRHEKISGAGIFQSIQTFDHLLEVYNFDRELRLLSLNAIERIEVAFRAILSDFMSLQYGPFWYMNDNCFKNKTYHPKVIEDIKIQISRESKSSPSIRHYFEKYTDPIYPPSWMLTEIMSFGVWSRIYSILYRKDRKKISDMFDLSPIDMESWLRCLTYLRNLCAHHARVFDRNFIVNEPSIPEQYKYLEIKRHKYAVCAFIILRLLKSVNSGHIWLEELKNLIEKYNISEIETMGLQNNWASIWENGLKFEFQKTFNQPQYHQSPRKSPL